MTLALYGKSRRRQGGLLLAGVVAVLVAMLAGVATFTAAFAHHNTYTPTGTCDGWTATSSYVGGNSKVLIIMDNVVIGGQNYQGSWSSGFATGSGTSGGVLQYAGGTIDGKSLPGSGTGQITDLTNVWYWFGTDQSASIFNRNGGWPAGAFSGRILLYYRSGSNWSFSLGDSVTPLSGDQGTITAPSRPSNCDRTIRIHKVVQGSGAPAKTFSYTISPAGINGTVSSTDSDDHSVPKNVAQTVTETEALSGGWSFVKYTRRQGLDSDCSGNSWSDQGTVQANGVSIPADSNDYTVCIYNKYTAPKTVKVQVHKYMPGPQGWQNQGQGQGDWEFTLYADNNGSKGSALPGSPNPFGHLTPSTSFSQQTVWIEETNTDGTQFFGWYLPEDPSSGNPQCNKSDNELNTATSLQIPASYFNVPGDESGVFHICAYNKPAPPPKVGLDKDDDGDGVYEVGESFNFRLKFKVSNGPTTQATVATDTVPAQFTVGDVTVGQPSGISCSKVGQTVTCTLAAGAANGTHTALIPVTVATGAQCGPVTNSAEITANSPHRDPEDYTGDEQVTIPCPQTVTLTLRVCKLIDADSYDTAEPFVITVSGQQNFEPNIAQGGEAGKLCKDYQFTVPANDPTTAVTINESEPTGWDQPKYTKKDQAGSATSPAELPADGLTVTLGQGTCDANQERQIQGTAVAVNPDCTVTIINNIPDPKVDVTFVKLMCGPDATIPSAFTNPNPVSYNPNNLPADCYPMAGWKFYTGTTWSNSTLGGVTATHTTGADGTVTHTMTQAEFDAATHVVAGQPYISYLVQEEERSPFTRGTLQCYMDYGGVNDNIEQVNFTTNPVSQQVTCIAYNKMPRVTVNFIKAICPALSDVPSNQGANADRGGLLGPADPAADVKVGLDNIPEDCTTVPGWQFNTGTEWNGSLGGSTASYTTVADGIATGIAGVKHTLTGAEFMAALAGYETTGKSYFVQEVEQSPDYLFGAIKCYADHYLDDKIERVDFAKWGLPGAEEEIYCIAYNVKAEREITIVKTFVGLPQGFEVTKDDYPAFVFDPVPANFDFATDCTPSGTNPVVWTCKVPYDWNGTVTETPAPGWQEVTCQREALAQLIELVQSVVNFEVKSRWEFCNRPVGTVVVVKYENVPPATPQNWTFNGTLPGAPQILSTTGTTNATGTASVTLQNVPAGSYTLAELEGHGQCQSGTTSSDYQTRGLVQVGGSIPGAGDVNAAAIIGANNLNVTVQKGTTTYVVFGNQGCGTVLSAANLQVFKYSDPLANFSGTTELGDWTISITGTAGAATGFNASQDTVAGTGAFFGGIPDGTYTVCETAKAGWAVVGSKYNLVNQAGVCRTGVAVVLDKTTVVNFYNQPRVNIEVNKTEISLATPAGGPGAGWSFTLTGCGITPQVAVTGANGKATFSDLPPAVGCTYTVTETVKSGWSAINPVQVTAPTAAGQTAVLNFTNVKIETCTNCVTIVTPTPTPPTPTATATPKPSETPTSPTATPETPTKPEPPKEEPTEDRAGAKTPGPGQTPIAPSTGNGLLGSGPAGVNMLLALVGLLALSLGTTILALGRKSSRR